MQKKLKDNGSRLGQVHIGRDSSGEERISWGMKHQYAINYISSQIFVLQDMNSIPCSLSFFVLRLNSHRLRDWYLPFVAQPIVPLLDSSFLPLPPSFGKVSQGILCVHLMAGCTDSISG